LKLSCGPARAEPSLAALAFDWPDWTGLLVAATPDWTGLLVAATPDWTGLLVAATPDWTGLLVAAWPYHDGADRPIPGGQAELDGGATRAGGWPGAERLAAQIATTTQPATKATMATQRGTFPLVAGVGLEAASSSSRCSSRSSAAGKVPAARRCSLSGSVTTIPARRSRVRLRRAVRTDVASRSAMAAVDKGPPARSRHMAASNG